jgi:hypothetical protein
VHRYDHSADILLALENPFRTLSLLFCSTLEIYSLKSIRIIPLCLLSLRRTDDILLLL